ncbi:hypothetical protein G8V07_15295 [Clostridium botulinum D/C]|uniref:hypothetical protein n=1 Tax=Clostridium botulinum TaxID=1491 RepID=UPI001E38B715|nr:hypothetical protein [Clostridium botulinum]MCD3321765.1 hypothetical protein [Clostridium botulinum D/C]MCD3325083.1 hypothetical protein [Clostridium botulinum D/C]MCD3327959.1 hypothetical protein [Clostridium botulinum D/C]
MANGKFAGGDGSTSDPYLIEDAFDLDKVRDNLNASYRLINDIDLNVVPFNEGEGWKSIGDYSKISDNFRFDGCNFKIKNLYVNNNCYGGLFEYIKGIVSNIIIYNFHIKSRVYTGGLASFVLENAKIINCGVKKGTINTSEGYVGGLVGQTNDKCIIQNSFTKEVDIHCPNGDFIGSFIGAGVNCNIKNCYSENNMLSYGKDQLPSDLGAFIGQAQYDIYLNQCYCSNVKVMNKNVKLKPIGFFNTGTDYKVVIENFYIDKNTINSDEADKYIFVTTEQLKNSSTFKSWGNEKLADGQPVWVLEDNEYPKLWFDKETKFLLKENKTENLFSFEDDVIVDLGKQQVIEQLYKEKGFDDVLDLNKTYKKKKMFFIEKENTNEGSISKINITDNILKILRIKI